MASSAAIPPAPTTPPSLAPERVVAAAALRGAALSTRDEQRLGTVKEATAACFLVDEPFAFDYWLSSRAIADVAPGRVHLGITMREVTAYLVDRDCLQDLAQLPPVTPALVVLRAAS